MTVEEALKIAVQHHQAGRLDEAEAMYRSIIAQAPDIALAHGNLGALFGAQGKFDEAAQAFTTAIELNPNIPEAHSNLGNILREQGKHEAAIAAHLKGIGLNPKNAVFHSNLGNVLRELGRVDESIASCARAIELKNDFPQARVNMGNAQKDSGRIDEAIESYRNAIALNPASADFHDNLCFVLHYQLGQDTKSILDEHRRWDQRHAEPLRRLHRPHENDRSPNRRLRVGYVSPDFKQHPVAKMFLPLIANHDREQFEVFCYSDVFNADELTNQVRSYAHQWRTISGISHERLAEQIRQDRIDILVDLTAHSAGNRLLTFARKPAPVQVTYMGYPSTTGLSAMDYRLTDPYLDPPGTDEFYSEKSIRLKHCFWCYQPPDVAGPTVELPATKNGFVTFGCLNNFSKVGPEVLNLWIEVMKVVGDSQLVLLSPPGRRQSELREQFSNAGIDRSRLHLLTQLSQAEYYARLSSIDVCLDPFPYNGHTSALDALWMGAPMVTLYGQTAVGRGGASILSNIQLPELIAPTREKYVEIAANLAGDLKSLEKLRSGMRQRMQSSPIMNAQAYARDVERAYRQMWIDWCGASQVR